MKASRVAPPASFPPWSHATLDTIRCWQELDRANLRRARRAARLQSLARAAAIAAGAVAAAVCVALLQGCGDNLPPAIEIGVAVRPLPCAVPPAAVRICGSADPATGLPHARCRDAAGAPLPAACTLAGPDRLCLPDCPAPASCPRGPAWSSIHLDGTRGGTCPGVPAKYAVPCGLCGNAAGPPLLACTYTVDVQEAETSPPIETPLFVCVASCSECAP